MNHHIKVTAILISTLCINFVHADIQKTIFDLSDLSETEKYSDIQKAKFRERRFRQYEDNSLILDYFGGNTLEQHIDAKLSVSYMLSNPDNAEYLSDRGDWNLAFSASVEFDFYMGTRHSGPVIGRRYNPGLQYYYSKNQKSGWQEYRFSIEHESNGQSTESLETLNSITADITKDYFDDPSLTPTLASSMAEETISMGNNFISAGGVYRFNSINSDNCNEELSCFDIHIKLRDNTLITDENSGNFRSLNAKNKNLSAYQGTSIGFFNHIKLFDKHKATIELSYITGQLNKGHPGKHNTFKAKVYYNWLYRETTIPLLLSCQSGYMHNLYNFSDKQTKCTAGFHFNY